MQCPHCNQEHPEGTQICPTTGEEIFMAEKCPECGKPVEPDWQYCGYCSQKLIRAAGMAGQPLPTPTPDPSKPAVPAPKTPWLIIAEILGFLVILAAIVFFVFMSGKR